MSHPSCMVMDLHRSRSEYAFRGRIITCSRFDGIWWNHCSTFFFYFFMFSAYSLWKRKNSFKVSDWLIRLLIQRASCWSECRKWVKQWFLLQTFRRAPQLWTTTMSTVVMRVVNRRFVNSNLFWIYVDPIDSFLNYNPSVIWIVFPSAANSCWDARIRAQFSKTELETKTWLFTCTPTTATNATANATVTDTTTATCYVCEPTFISTKSTTDATCHRFINVFSTATTPTTACTVSGKTFCWKVHTLEFE